LERRKYNENSEIHLISLEELRQFPNKAELKLVPPISNKKSIDSKILSAAQFSKDLNEISLTCFAFTQTIILTFCIKELESPAQNGLILNIKYNREY